jgi:RND family efflux transporter MFP subunit
MKTLLATAVAFVLLAVPLRAETQVISPQPVTDWKAVFGQVQAQTLLPARARIGGVLTELTVAEGDMVDAGQPLARIEDEKLDLQLTAMDAQITAISAQLDNARSELARGQELLARGVTTVQFLDGLRTQADVLEGQLAAMQAERAVIAQQASEGVVLAPIGGRVLTVPLAAGAVVMPGEAVATLGGGGFFLRLAIPERHAGALREGDEIAIATHSTELSGTLARVYPQIENGRVIADVAVDALDDAFVNARVLVRLPVGQRMALLVPEGAVTTRSGLDFVTVEGAFAGPRAVVPGPRHQTEAGVMVEILSGLAAGDTVVLP